MELEVRELRVDDIEVLLDYWYNCSPEYLHSLGADISKLPPREDFKKMLEYQLTLPVSKKDAYALIWTVDGQPIGHSNVNRILFGLEATMHLHIWDTELRKEGFGTGLLKKSLPYYFEKLELKKLWCEPYSKNRAPSRTLKRAGFDFVKKYRTIPGSLNFEQEVNQWVMSCEKFNRLYF